MLALLILTIMPIRQYAELILGFTIVIHHPHSAEYIACF
jgi:hypothetical protein